MIEKAVVEDSDRISGLLERKEGEEFFNIRDELKNMLDEKVGISELSLTLRSHLIR